MERIRITKTASRREGAIEVDTRTPSGRVLPF